MSEMLKQVQQFQRAQNKEEIAKGDVDPADVGELENLPHGVALTPEAQAKLDTSQLIEEDGIEIDPVTEQPIDGSQIVVEDGKARIVRPQATPQARAQQAANAAFAGTDEAIERRMTKPAPKKAAPVGNPGVNTIGSLLLEDDE
jgi:hypothetical protein